MAGAGVISVTVGPLIGGAADVFAGAIGVGAVGGAATVVDVEVAVVVAVVVLVVPDVPPPHEASAIVATPIIKARITDVPSA